MIERLIAATIFAVILACAYVASVKWQEDKHPLLITAAQPDATAMPHPQALFSPCPLTKTNVLPIRRKWS